MEEAWGLAVPGAGTYRELVQVREVVEVQEVMVFETSKGNEPCSWHNPFSPIRRRN